MNSRIFAAGLAALWFPLSVLAATPAPPGPLPAAPHAAKLVAAGVKGTSVVLIDMATRRTVRGSVEADGLLVFPPAPVSAAEAPAPPAPEGEDGSTPAVTPDHGRITLRFDCKGRTISLIRDTLMDADNNVLMADLPAMNPQAPVDPTDARLLALACGEAFPEADMIYDSEAAAMAGVRNPA